MKHVLLVDDCEEFCSATSELLEDAGYEVTVAMDACGILELCAQEDFQVMLCDLVLPFPEQAGDEPAGDSAMVGLNLVRQVKDRFPDLRVVIISGQLVGSPLQTMRYFGADAVLAKPFDRAALVDCIENVTTARDN